MSSLGKPPNAPPPPSFLNFNPTAPIAASKNKLINDMLQMQARFQFAASNIQPILNTRAVKKTPKSFADLIKTGVPSSVAEADADDNDEDDGNSKFQPVNTTTQIASQLMIWKDDVTQLLEMVQGHIVRCQKIEDHEVHSHKPKETQLDFRRKRINDFLLSMKADLRALTR